MVGYDVPETELRSEQVYRDAAVRRRYTVVFLSLATAAALYVCYLMVRPFVKPVLFAAVVTIVFYPVHLRIWSRVRQPNLAALASTLFVLLIVIVPLVALGGAVTAEIRQAYQSLSVKSAEGGGWTPYLTEVFQKPLAALGRHVDLSGFDLRSSVQSRLEQMSSWSVRLAADVVSNLGIFVFDAAISFFTLFFLFREGRRVRLTMAAVLPLDEERVERLFASISDTIVANLYGVVAVALAQGTLMGFAYFLLGVSSPILWGALTAVCSLIPLVGSSLVWLPITVVLVATGHWGKAVVLLAWSAAFLSLADHVLRPYIIGGRVKMNTLFVFFSLLGGIKAFGLLGIFLGPLILSITVALLGILREEVRTSQSGPGADELRNQTNAARD
jgi:predicted PurR-regulated permease PerM